MSRYTKHGKGGNQSIVVNDLNVSSASIDGTLSAKYVTSGPVVSHTFGVGDADATATAADLQNGFWYPSAALTAGRALNIPTAAALYAAYPTIGASFHLTVNNTQAGAFARTVTLGAGGAFTVGTGAVAQNTTAVFLIVITSATTYEVFRLVGV